MFLGRYHRKALRIPRCFCLGRAFRFNLFFVPHKRISTSIPNAKSRIMSNVQFKYKKHPQDLLRNTDVILLPNPKEDLESILVQFLKHYQSDERIAYIDDLYKYIDNDFSNEEDKLNFIKINGKKNEKEIKDEIQRIEIELKNEAYENFYNLVLTGQIEIIKNEK